MIENRNIPVCGKPFSHHGRTLTQGFLGPETQRNMCLTYQAAIRGCRYAAVVRTARLQVSCTVYCSVPSHCLADFVEPPFLPLLMVLLLFLLLLLMLVLLLSLLPLLFLLLLTLVLVPLLLLLWYCFSDLGFSCLHPRQGDYFCSLFR